MVRSVTKWKDTRIVLIAFIYCLNKLAKIKKILSFRLEKKTFKKIKIRAKLELEKKKSSENNNELILQAFSRPCSKKKVTHIRFANYVQM